MTESDNQPVFDPATDADAPVEETTPTEEVTPEAPTQPEQPEPAPETPVQPEPTPDNNVETDSTPVPDVPGAQDAVSDTSDAYEVPAQPVSGVPTPGAVSDPKPEQTDNTERPEDGEQDVSQDPTVVPSNDEDPDVVA